MNKHSATKLMLIKIAKFLRSYVLNKMSGTSFGNSIVHVSKEN